MKQLNKGTLYSLASELEGELAEMLMRRHIAASRKNIENNITDKKIINRN